jgi:hypothetical protein
MCKSMSKTLWITFLELWNVEGLLVNIVPFTMFYGAHFFFYYQHGQHEEGVTIIESPSSMEVGWILRWFLFALAHYRTFLKSIAQAPNCVFPSLMDDTHIMGPMSEVVPAFDHFSTQLALVGFKVKVLKCKLWSSSKIFWGIEIPQGCTLVIDDLCILGVPVGS